MVAKTFVDVLTGTSFVSTKSGANVVSPATGKDAYTVTGTATVAIGFYKGEILRLCVEVESVASYEMQRYRPRFPGSFGTDTLVSYTVSWQVSRTVRTTHRYFWQVEGGAKEYLPDASATYEATEVTRQEVDTVALQQEYGGAIEWRPGLRLGRQIEYVERTIGSSIVCKSADPSKKMAVFYRSEVESPVVSREGVGWRYWVTWKDGRDDDHSTGYYATEAQAIESYVATQYHGDNIRVFRGGGSVQAQMPDVHYRRPDCTVYAYVYLPTGRVYKERIMEADGGEYADATAMGYWTGETYVDSLTVGTPELALGGVYGPREGQDYTVGCMPPLFGTTYPAASGKTGLVLFPRVPVGGLFVAISSLEVVVPSLRANFPVLSEGEGSESDIAYTVAERDAGWPAQGYFRKLHEGEVRALAIPTKAK